MAIPTNPPAICRRLVLMSGLFLYSSADLKAEENENIQALAGPVAEYEQRFENMELNLLSEYELKQPFDPEDDGLTKLKTRRVHQVTQRPFAFIHRSSIGVAVDGDVTNRDSSYAYDGKTSRVISTNEVDDFSSVIIEKDPQGGSGLWAPHTAVVYEFFWSKMKMSDALLLDSHDEYRLRTHVSGGEKIGKLQCIKVTTEFWSPGRKRPDLTHFWFCPERSYLPIKREGYLHGDDGYSLVEACEVEKFKELDAGLWIPLELERTVYYQTENGDGKNAVSNVTKYYVKNMKLHPKYPPDFFQLTIPDGARVYECRAGTVIKKYWFKSSAGGELNSTDEKPGSSARNEE